MVISCAKLKVAILIWSSQLGELTDKGRETTLALGQRLRHLYVDQLGFMPKSISDADMIYLRATPMARALESLQQSFEGMYPPSTRQPNFPPPTVITRTPADENLFPNDSNCRRFNQLSRAFAQRAADRCWSCICHHDSSIALSLTFGKGISHPKWRISTSCTQSGCQTTPRKLQSTDTHVSPVSWIPSTLP